MFESGDLSFGALASRSRAAAADDGDSGGPAWLRDGFVFPEDGFVLDEAINTLVERALELGGGNVSAAARLVGATRDFGRYRLKQKPAGG